MDTSRDKQKRKKCPPKFRGVSMKTLRANAESATGWDRLIAEGKIRVVQMKQSIRYWEEQRDMGVPFPVELKG